MRTGRTAAARAPSKFRKKNVSRHPAESLRPAKAIQMLVAIDFSPESNRALRAAARLARRKNASLTVMHVRNSSDLRAAVEENRGDLLRLERPELRRQLAAHYRTRLEAARKSAGARRAVLLRGWPPARIAREAARGYDFVVISSRGRGAVRRALFGSTAEELLHRPRVPVLVITSPSRKG